MPPARKTRSQERGRAGALGLPVWPAAKATRIRVGISGWTYPPWRGTFYPQGLRQDDVRHRIALIVADTAGKWPALEIVTADFVYVRLHGDSELNVSDDTDSALNEWSHKIEAWSLGKGLPSPKILEGAHAPKGARRDVFAYFDNEVKVRAPFDAINMAHRLGIGPESPNFAPTLVQAGPARTPCPAFPTHHGPKIAIPEGEDSNSAR